MEPKPTSRACSSVNPLLPSPDQLATAPGTVRLFTSRGNRASLQGCSCLCNHHQDAQNIHRRAQLVSSWHGRLSLPRLYGPVMEFNAPVWSPCDLPCCLPRASPEY